MVEKVSVTVPGLGPQIIEIEVRASEGDDEIARRLSKTFPIGTILGVSGSKWKVQSQDPPVVIELGLPRTDGPQPGEVWKPKDPRRKSGFTIRAVTETEVIAEDGRRVSLDRLKRYERVS